MRSIESSKMLTTRLRAEFVILCIVPVSRWRGGPLDQLGGYQMGSRPLQPCSLPALQMATDRCPADR